MMSWLKCDTFLMTRFASKHSVKIMTQNIRTDGVPPWEQYGPVFKLLMEQVIERQDRQDKRIADIYRVAFGSLWGVIIIIIASLLNFILKKG